jgi:hypothetical protein
MVCVNYQFILDFFPRMYVYKTFFKNVWLQNILQECMFIKYTSKIHVETAWSALAKSCYATIDWKIHENADMMTAITRMSMHNIGALAVVSDKEDGRLV